MWQSPNQRLCIANAKACAYVLEWDYLPEIESVLSSIENGLWNWWLAAIRSVCNTPPLLDYDTFKMNVLNANERNQAEQANIWNGEPKTWWII